MKQTVEGQRTGKIKESGRKRAAFLFKSIKEGEEEGQKDGLNMSLRVSGPALNYNEGKKK